MRSELGRGPTATLDMKRRIVALRKEGCPDVLAVLWRRHQLAVMGEGFVYEYAEQEEPAAAL